MQTSMEPANGLNGSKHRKMATMLSIIPGVGQMYNKQFVKGLIFSSINRFIYCSLC